jgi:hypothetical protein
MVHGLYEWIWNGSDAFPDFLTWLLARKQFAHRADWIRQRSMDKRVSDVPMAPG